MLLLLMLACGGNPTDDPDVATTDDWVLDDTPLDPFAPVEPLGEWTVEMFEDRQLVWYMPENPRAMVWHFHGTDGTAADARLIETVAILNELIAIDIGFVAATCDDGYRWDDDNSAPDNDDLDRLTRIRDHIMAQSNWTEDTPIFAWGFSNGAQMTAHFAEYALDEGWPMRAISAHNGDPRKAVVPTLFVEATHDRTANASAIANTRDDVVDAGLDMEAYMALEEPLDARRFMRIPTMNEEKSQLQFDELVAWGHIEAGGTRITSWENINGVVNQIEAASAGWDPVRSGEQMRVVWRTHRVDGQYALEERNFFVKHLP